MPDDRVAIDQVDSQIDFAIRVDVERSSLEANRASVSE